MFRLRFKIEFVIMGGTRGSVFLTSFQETLMVLASLLLGVIKTPKSLPAARVAAGVGRIPPELGFKQLCSS